MSQLRKSASFRSRIPVRKSKISLRRCNSPSPLRVQEGIPENPCSGLLLTAGNDDNEEVNERWRPDINGRKDELKSRIKKELLTSMEVSKENNKHKSEVITDKENIKNSQSHLRQKQKQRRFQRGVVGKHARRQQAHYLSSSFSSSDESNESEIPVQYLIRKFSQSINNSSSNNNENNDENNKRENIENVVEENFHSTSTDAISLDGLLESISSGSFSNSPSPVQNASYGGKMRLSQSSSYESLSRNHDSETFKLKNACQRQRNPCIQPSLSGISIDNSAQVFQSSSLTDFRKMNSNNRHHRYHKGTVQEARDEVHHFANSRRKQNSINASQTPSECNSKSNRDQNLPLLTPFEADENTTEIASFHNTTENNVTMSSNFYALNHFNSVPCEANTSNFHHGSMKKNIKQPPLPPVLPLPPPPLSASLLSPGSLKKKKHQKFNLDLKQFGYIPSSQEKFSYWQEQQEERQQQQYQSRMMEHIHSKGDYYRHQHRSNNVICSSSSPTSPKARAPVMGLAAVTVAAMNSKLNSEFHPFVNANGMMKAMIMTEEGTKNYVDDGEKTRNNTEANNKNINSSDENKIHRRNNKKRDDNSNSDIDDKFKSRENEIHSTRYESSNINLNAMMAANSNSVSLNDFVEMGAVANAAPFNSLQKPQQHVKHEKQRPGQCQHAKLNGVEDPMECLSNCLNKMNYDNNKSSEINDDSGNVIPVKDTVSYQDDHQLQYLHQSQRMKHYHNGEQQYQQYQQNEEIWHKSKGKNQHYLHNEKNYVLSANHNENNKRNLSMPNTEECQIIKTSSETRRTLSGSNSYSSVILEEGNHPTHPSCNFNEFGIKTQQFSSEKFFDTKTSSHHVIQFYPGDKEFMNEKHFHRANLNNAGNSSPRGGKNRFQKDHNVNKYPKPSSGNTSKQLLFANKSKSWKRSDETSTSSFEQLNLMETLTNVHHSQIHEEEEEEEQEEEQEEQEHNNDKCYQQNHHNYHYHRDEQKLQEEYYGVKGWQYRQQNDEDEKCDNLRKTSEIMDIEQRKYLEAKRRPLPKLPSVSMNMIFPPKTTNSYRSDCELSGSYVSLECPSPPGPPACFPESRRDPQARLGNYLKTLYTDLALKEPIIPQWAIPVAPGALCPAKLEPELRLHAQSHGFNDGIIVDQLLTSIHTKEGTFLEAPRRVLVECPSWTSRSNLSLKILHAWAKEPPWPPKGTPVALALFIPLNEIKRCFANYVEKELLPKGPLNPFSSGFGGFANAWNSLESLGPKLLILLDGYDTQRGSPKRKGKYYPPDVHDLLDGKLFPEARVIITTSTSNNTELLPLVQRHITYEGLTWGRSASLLGGGQWGAPSRLLDTVQECQPLRRIVRTPQGCLAIAAIYEATAGDLPTDELDVIESVLNCVAPETSPNNVAELGRLALFCLKMKRPCITGSEIRMYCSSPDSSIMGCLDRNLLLGKTARKKGELIYNYICPGMEEFLAANYIASLVNRPGLLAAEITGLSMGDELESDLLKVITFAMGLLGNRAHVLLSKLTPLWLTPQTTFTLALAGGSSEDNQSALCDMLGISKHPPISPLETKPIWVQIRSVPTELMGWGMALKSPSCTLKNLELIYQLEKHILLDSRNAVEIFLESLLHNESVSTLRITSLIETDVKESEINYLANCVSKALIKPRLENFELILTLLEEDPPLLKLQAVVTALCRSIPRQPKLTSLLLDLGLSTSQLVQLCTTLDKCPNVNRLSLPHLRCERGAITALASLLNSRPISFLALPSCWGARDDPPSSSGVSMGSGSGSSTGTSGLIKQGSLTGVPSPRSYPPGLFSSLPRGVFVPTTTMGRSATLPRQPIEPPPDKRSSDSVVSKTWYPTPACDGGPHNSGTLHDLLLAAREPYSKLHGLDLSKAQLSLEDSMCLGETIRLSNTLHTLKLEGSSRLSEILPSVLGASESPCLQMLSIGSPRLNLEDSAISMSARSLTSCSTLRLLSLDGWSFRIENPSTLSIIRAFLSLTSIRELSLANCRLQIGIIKSDTKIMNPFESRSVVVLKLAGAQAILGDSTVIRGPQLLPFIGGFPCLRELDLSAPARSGFGSTVSSPLILDDKCLLHFFQSLHTHFSLLNTLKICNWVIHLDEPAKTLKGLSKCIRNSPLSHLKLDGVSILDRPKKIRIEPQFVHCFISSLNYLRWMGISLSGKKENQITAIGNAVLDLKGYEIDIKLSESTIDHAKLMAQAISVDGKFDIKVSTFGTSSGILVHAEKSGTKSLSRKQRD